MISEKLRKENIVDEICDCGHLKSEHEDTKNVQIMRCRECTKAGCDCERFSWRTFLVLAMVSIPRIREEKHFTR